MNVGNVRTRFLVSVGGNICRAILSFISSLLVARSLNPTGYGELMFLLGSFAAIGSLLDMGSSSAFFTFLSRQTRRRTFFSFYFGWLAAQFLVTALVITLLIPESLFDKIWLGNARSLVLLALAASFLQQQAWQTVTQIGEAARLTAKVQLIGLVVASAHFIAVVLFVFFGNCSVSGMLWLFIAEYSLAAFSAGWFLRNRSLEENELEVNQWSFREMLAEYTRYCKPLVIVSWVGFAHAFADRWLLQRFGGADEQGYFQVAGQFSAVSLIATASILNIFWKEIAEANAQLDFERVAVLYQKVNRSLFFLAAVISGFLIPWTPQLVIYFLGNAYLKASPVLMIMFLYPIHQSMGQITGTLMMASSLTGLRMKVSVAVMAVSLPISYLVQAPPTAWLVPGLGLGALGIALKMVIINIVAVNISAIIVSRNFGWKNCYLFQIAGPCAALAFGFLTKLAVEHFIYSGVSSEFIPFLLSGSLYVLMLLLLLWLMPSIVGMERNELIGLFRRPIKV